MHGWVPVFALVNLILAEAIVRFVITRGDRSALTPSRRSAMMRALACSSLPMEVPRCYDFRNDSFFLVWPVLSW